MKHRQQFLQLCIGFCSLLFCINSQALTGGTGTENRAYPVPGHGELMLDVPGHWEVTYVSMGNNKPPLITFFNKDETDREIFQLNISILWDDGFKRDITSPDLIHGMVEESGRELLQQSRENDLDLIPIDGISGTGYYFRLSDAAPRPGEYPYLTQGALSVGNVVIIFSLFTHQQDSPEVQESLEMLRYASQRFQPHV